MSTEIKKIKAAIAFMRTPECRSVEFSAARCSIYIPKSTAIALCLQKVSELEEVALLPTRDDDHDSDEVNFSVSMYPQFNSVGISAGSEIC